MKNNKKIIGFLITILFLVSGVAFAASSIRYERHVYPRTTDTFDLGSASNVWDTIYVNNCVGTGCGGAADFAWTPQSWGNSTSTTLGFLGGFLSNGSSTISGSLFIENQVHIASSTGDGLSIGDPGDENLSIDIDGITYSSRFKVNDYGATNLAQSIIHRHANSAGPLILGARARGNTTDHTAVTEDTEMLQLAGAGWTGSHYDIFGAIEIEADAGTISSTSAPGKIVFSTTPDGSDTQREVVRMIENANIGISTTSPFARLSVHGDSTNYTDTLFAVGSSTPTGTSTLFKIEASGNVIAERIGIQNSSPVALLDIDLQGFGSIVGLIIEAASAQTANLTEWNGTAGTVVAVVDENGNIGLGDSTPNAKLHINGGNLYVLWNGMSPLFLFGDTTSAGSWGGIQWDSSGDKLRLGTQAASGSGPGTVDTLVLDESGGVVIAPNTGNTGIATTSPFAKLSVHGDSQNWVDTLFAIGSSTPTGTTTLFKVDSNGNTQFNKFYSEVYMMNNATVTPQTQNVYQTIGSGGAFPAILVDGLSNGFTLATPTTTPLYDGVYKAVASVGAGNGGSNHEYHIAIHIDDVHQDNCHMPRKIGAAGDVGALTVSCLLDLNDGEEVTVKVENITGSTDITVNDFNFTLEYIGLPL